MRKALPTVIIILLLTSIFGLGFTFERVHASSMDGGMNADGCINHCLQLANMQTQPPVILSIVFLLAVLFFAVTGVYGARLIRQWLSVIVERLPLRLYQFDTVVLRE